MSDHALLLKPDDFGPTRTVTRPSVPRSESLRDRLLLWADSMCRRLEGFGVWLGREIIERGPRVSVERPAARWVVRFSRAPATRTDHASLVFALDPTGVEVALFIPECSGGPMAALRRRVDDSVASAELVAALAAMPDEFDVAVGDETIGPCRTLDREGLAGLFDRAVREKMPVRVGWYVPREVALEHRNVLSEQLGDAIVSLASLYRLLPDPPPSDQRPARALERGERVRVLGGPFAGHVGTVAEVDARGARVMLGLLSARIEERGLRPVGPDGDARRPALPTSHRRIPARQGSTDGRFMTKQAAPGPNAPTDAPGGRPRSSVGVRRGRRAQPK